jgi:hypothetical protein
MYVIDGISLYAEMMNGVSVLHILLCCLTGSTFCAAVWFWAMWEEVEPTAEFATLHVDDILASSWALYRCCNGRLRQRLAFPWAFKRSQRTPWPQWLRRSAEPSLAMPLPATRIAIRVTHGSSSCTIGNRRLWTGDIFRRQKAIQPKVLDESYKSSDERWVVFVG